MSNLWFFRLKRAEQQRRRSSGEQSVGSSSVQSMAAISAAISAASLPVGPEQQQQQQQQQQHQQQQYEQHQQCERRETNTKRLLPEDELQEELQEEQASFCEQSVSIKHERSLPGDQTYRYRFGRMEPLERPPARPHHQVTIIRSDSTSSFIPMSLDWATGAPSGSCEPSSAARELPDEVAGSGAETVSRLQADGSVSTVRLLAGEFVATSECPNVDCQKRASSGSNELRHQLVSGKVPPIHQRLLNPLGANTNLADSVDNLAALIPRVRVEFYNSENTLKEKLQMYFIKDHKFSLYIRTAKLVLKVLACYLYVWRVILDRGPAYANCYGCQTRPAANLSTTAEPANSAPLSKFDSHPYDGPINFRALFWVDRGPVVWYMQANIAVICFLEAILMQYLTYKNSIFSIISFHFILELVTNTPFIISIFIKELRTLFVPGFLNCWLAKQCLEAVLNDLSIVRQSSVFSHRLTILSATVFCLIFTSQLDRPYSFDWTKSACGFQHTQRSGGRNYITIFESIYFVVVTFSTVGYGDFKPETWPSQLLIMVMICVALIVLPTQFEQLAYFWIERKKLGASYAHHSTRHEKHVVVCSTTLRADTIMDFLNEFYAHPLLQTFSVVLLSPCELESTMKLVLQTPTWNNRVVYIQGSALKAQDLIRARMQSAEACFILAARNYNDRSAADEHTILRSWAIRDFSPYVPQYVQIFRTENKIHVAFAEHVVCDDEFKYALLANNCLIPGTSTLVTLLLHTSQQKHVRRRRRRRRRHQYSTKSKAASLLANLWPWTNDYDTRQSHSKAPDEPQDTGPAGDDQDDQDDQEELEGEAQWKRLYGKCSANEIYHIRLSDSRFFGEYQGKSFTYASFHSHRKFGVALIGVQTDMRGTWPIMLNPGPSYVLKSSDILFYINITKEENSTLMPIMQRGYLDRPEAPTSSPVQQSESAGQAGTATTFICVQSSSPTPGQPNQPNRGQADERPLLETPGPEQQLLTLKKHSVAEGAGMIARSLCSVAGIVSTEMSAASEPPGQRDQPAELQALAASLRMKRNSSASTAGVAAGLSVRNASTLDLAALAGGLRKGSNISIASTKSRDISPAKLRQVVSGLAVKMRRVKLGKSLTHLTIPRMDYGGSSASSTESFVNARGRRPSIAPVPAMLGESEDHDSDHEREQESYFSTSWQSTSETSPIVKKFVFCTTYVGVSPTLCYLLQHRKPACCLQLTSACEHCPYRNARQYNWPNKCIILASDFASNGIYNFLVPLRAHFHNPSELRPIVLLLERKPSLQFIDAISWFPMVYWMPGSIDNLDDLIRAGINLAQSVVVTNKESTNSAEEDYLADCNTIVAVQTMFKMFPSAGIITELSQSSNMRFMQFRAHDLLLGGLSGVSHLRLGSLDQQSGNDCAPGQSASDSYAQGNAVRDRIYLRKLHSQNYTKSMGKEQLNSHGYKYRLPFAAGNVFSASMLDTLLYQAFVKDYMITMVRLLLGIDQAPGSGFLSSMRITKEELWIRTYGRLYQRLCSTTCEIPLGIYRTEPLESQRAGVYSLGPFASQQASYEQATEELERIEITNMVKNRLQDLGMLVSDYDDSSSNRNNTLSYVIINPNCDTPLREGDIIYLIRPSPIHSRRLFMHRANSVRHTEHSTTPAPASHRSGPQASAPAPEMGQSNQATRRASQHSLGAGQQQAAQELLMRERSSPLATIPAQQQQQPPLLPPSDQAAQLEAHFRQPTMKPCLSDGDFNEILIRVDDQSAPNDYLIDSGPETVSKMDARSISTEKSARRRRSSCSDAE